jgi:hypothetical protein
MTPTVVQTCNVITFPDRRVSEMAQPSEWPSKEPRVPRNGDDRIFSYILQHSIAAAEGRTSDAELFLRSMLFAGPQTRKGLIALLKYLATLTRIEFAAGTPLERCIDGQSLVHSFFNSLASHLRCMRSEFPAEKRVRAKPVR